jgi:hypothetical protein
MVDQVLASQRSRWVLVVCLPVTLLYGPVGILLFAAAQAMSMRRSA